MGAFTLWLVFALASLAGYFFRLWRHERRLRLVRNTWSAASHDRWAGDNATWQARCERLSAKLTNEAIFDAMYLVCLDMKSGFYGPQPAQEFAFRVATVLAAVNWEQRRAALHAARFEGLPE